MSNHQPTAVRSRSLVFHPHSQCGRWAGRVSRRPSVAAAPCGSWNRNPPIGYDMVRIRFDRAGNPTGMESFVSGWLVEGRRAHFGQLMGIAQARDGSLLVGDDTNGVIYRISDTGGR
ncbi:MAG TPA: hypothetical protein VGR27_06815 [Longimicrobiaceae bacterium]|nr:hypothetical protein [Longimicrobiaceae bacterium]